MYVDLNDFLPDPCRIVASSEQGIIVTESGHPTDNDLAVFHVCKPTTKQFQVLPNPESKYYTFKAAIVIIGVKPLHYKIFRLSFSPTWIGFLLDIQQPRNAYAHVIVKQLQVWCRRDIISDFRSDANKVNGDFAFTLDNLLL
ncbi:hypothetical protein L2E82_01599 [Cichorium intybus]|uniref:Uncharacterized protein n=1 Tax=Cichorium intybus TaxID=13427 RepID=A0ACB9H0F6_CICIN|nr:hypothetical protein L2E82_01599 [Cichorium intybus]